MHRVYFILGCTACGKGSVGREIARRAGGSVISVDSMKVYRGMDIGTAKPSTQVRHKIPHCCIDIADPGDGFSVARYVEFADDAIADVRSVGSIPVAVGGTNLYIKALCEGLFDGPPADASVRDLLRSRAEQEGLQILHAELADVDAEAACRIHPNDAKRIIRALEVYKITGKPISLLQRQWGQGSRRYDCVFVGIRRAKEDVHGRINRRVGRMMANGLVDEVKSLLADGAGLSPQAAQGVGYAEIIAYLQGQCDLPSAVERIKINTRRLAKKQRTWHRRWRDVQWFDVSLEEPPDQTAERIFRSVHFE